jgi:hypothetical protein
LSHFAGILAGFRYQGLITQAESRPTDVASLFPEDFDALEAELKGVEDWAAEEGAGGVHPGQGLRIPVGG